MDPKPRGLFPRLLERTQHILLPMNGFAVSSELSFPSSPTFPQAPVIYGVLRTYMLGPDAELHAWKATEERDLLHHGSEVRKYHIPAQPNMQDPLKPPSIPPCHQVSEYLIQSSVQSLSMPVTTAYSLPGGSLALTSPS